MIGVDHLLLSLVESLPTGDGTLRVVDADLELPIETRIAAGGELLASLPRGRMATGFQSPLGRLRLTLACEVR